jgi:hypothetical protein
MRRALLVCVAILAGCAAPAPIDEEPAEPVEVTAHVDRADPVPGRPFHLTITVDRAEDVEFALPDIGGELKGLIVVKQRREGPERVAGRVVTRDIYTLKAPVTGVYRIPGVEAPYRAPGDVVGTAGTATILIEAGRHGDEESRGSDVLRDIKPPAPPDFDPLPLLIGAALLLLVVAAIVAVVLVRRRAEPAPPAIPPHEQARRDLDRLLAGGALRAPDQGPFAYELSAILRRYLEARYAFRAWRMTTPEVLRALPGEVAERRDVEASIRNVLEASDIIKFAAQTVPVETLQSWGSDVRSVVEATAWHSESTELQAWREQAP